MTPLLVTGNSHKARYFSEILGYELKNVRVDIEEIQSLDPVEVVSSKAKHAYAVVKSPVIVEDTYVYFTDMNRLPGTFIKHFLEELGTEGLCRLANSLSSNAAQAGAVIALYDGSDLHIMKRHIKGTIAPEPRGDSSFGWNPIFIPEGQGLTLGQMDEKTFVHYYKQIKPFEELRALLDKVQP